MIRGNVVGGVRLAAANTIGGLRTGSRSYKTVWTLERQKYFERMLRRKGSVTSWSTRWSSCQTNRKTVTARWKVLLQVLREKSRKGIMDRLRKFTDVDNRDALDVGGLRHGTKSVKVVKPRFAADFSEAVIREGAEELNSRVEEVGSSRAFIDTTHVEAKRGGPPPVVVVWHAFCQVILPR